MVRYALIVLLIPLVCCQVGCRKKSFRAPETGTAEAPAFVVQFEPNGDGSFTANAAFAAPSGPATPPLGPIDDFVNLFNNERVAIGAPGGAIPWDPVLAGVAQAQLDDMLNNNYFSVNSPSGATFPIRAVSSGSTWFTLTFGIGKGFPTAPAFYGAVRGNPDFDNAVVNYFAVSPTGIGVAFSTSRGGFWSFIIRD